MCLAVPVEVVEVMADELAVVNIGGIRSRVSTALVEDVAEGDYLIVHVGHAIARLDVAEAERTLALFREIADHLEGEPDALRS